jgi:ABC-type glycerol-3-phosphate transport system permease component
LCLPLIRAVGLTPPAAGIRDAATFIPAYVIVSRLGWVDTYWALVVPFAASGFGVFLMRQAFLVVPQALVEAARIDGAGHWTILTRVLMPLARPATITLAALSFTFHYNDFSGRSLSRTRHGCARCRSGSPR